MVRLPLDVRDAWRSLRTRPASSSYAVLVLALGVGLTTAMFALADPFLLRQLPYRDSESIVIVRPRVDLTRAVASLIEGRSVTTSPDWQAPPGIVTEMALYRNGPTLRVRTNGAVMSLQTIEATSNLFRLLGGN